MLVFFRSLGSLLPFLQGHFYFQKSHGMCLAFGYSVVFSRISCWWEKVLSSSLFWPAFVCVIFTILQEDTIFCGLCFPSLFLELCFCNLPNFSSFLPFATWNWVLWNHLFACFDILKIDQCHLCFLPELYGMLPSDDPKLFITLFLVGFRAHFFESSQRKFTINHKRFTPMQGNRLFWFEHYIPL